MGFLTQLFSPSFFMSLGVILLAVALVVLHYENKLREQNHKIATMFSLVSTMAEDLTGIKMAMRAERMEPLFDLQPTVYSNNNKVIEVSDDEESEHPEDLDYEVEDEINDGEDNDTDNDTENDTDNEINEDNDDVYDNEDMEDLDDLVFGELNEELELAPAEELELEEQELELEEQGQELEEQAQELQEQAQELQEQAQELEEQAQELEEQAQELEEQEEQEKVILVNQNEIKVLKLSQDDYLVEENDKQDFLNAVKTVSMIVTDQQVQQASDVKKYQLPKLRQQVVEKGLSSATEAAKLKKPELLKLLGME